MNENHIIGAMVYRQDYPENITFELLWADDALAADKTLSNL